MCLSVCDASTATDADNCVSNSGAYWMMYSSGDADTEDGLTDSRVNTYYTTAEWTAMAGNYVVGDGTDLTEAANGMANTPDVSSAGCTGCYAAAASIVTSWYQPEADAETATILRIQAGDLVNSWAINGADGTAMESCNAAVITLLG